jgi:NitT/TauT family transport system substrate-binding protein
MDARILMRSVLTRRAVLAGAAAGLIAPVAARGQAVSRLNVAGVPEDSITPLLYADQAGVFKRYGIAVNLSPERSGSAIASGIVGGAFDVAKSSLTGLIVARSKNIPFVLVAAGGVYAASAPIVGLLVKTDSPIKVAADLNHKTVAVSALGDIYALSTLAWMEKNGGQPKTVKQLEFPVSAVPDALLNGRVDAAAVVEPILQSALDSGKLRSIGAPFTAIADRFLYTCWFATASWATQHSAEVSAFNHAIRDASVYTNEHRPQTVELLAKYSSTDPAIVAKMTRVENGTVLDVKLIQPVIDASAKYNFIASSFPAADLVAPMVRN